MESLHIAALVTTCLSLAIVGGFILWKSPRGEFPLLTWIFLLILPMSPLTFTYVRIPLDHLLLGILSGHPLIFDFCRTFYAPLTEEPAKIWILLFPLFRERVHKKNALRVAMTAGLAFGIGEAWLVASLLLENPEVSRMPWYLLGGYMNERFMVCVMHGVFTATALRMLGHSFRRGLLYAMGLHYLANFPLYLASIDSLGPGDGTCHIILTLWVQVYFLAMLALFAHYAYGKVSVGLLLGRATCPDCCKQYDRPLFGVNLVFVRYERCPRCGVWHWVKENWVRKQ